MYPLQLLYYSLSIFVIVATIGLIINIVLMVGILVAVKDAVQKVRDVAVSAWEMEQRAKKNVLSLLLNVLDFIT